MKSGLRLVTTMQYGVDGYVNELWRWRRRVVAHDVFACVSVTVVCVCVCVYVLFFIKTVRGVVL